MRGRDRRQDEDETRRRFNAVWLGSAQQPDSIVDGWRYLDEKPDRSSPAGRHAEPDDEALVAAGPDEADYVEPLPPPTTRESARAVLGAFDPGRRACARSSWWAW